MLAFYVGLGLGLLGGYAFAVRRVAEATVARCRMKNWDDFLAFSDELEVALLPAPIRRHLDRKLTEQFDDSKGAVDGR